MRYKLFVIGICLIANAACKSEKVSTDEPVVFNSLECETGSFTKQTEPEVGLNLGNLAPEIAQKNLEDSIIRLSSLRGKLVLIDFWASWCGPCRKENPTVVKAYTKFRDKKFKGGMGFTIYSVSLDNDKTPWKKAIEKDGLIWPNHVSDLKVWNNEASQRYGVNGIPYNVLINDKGIIIDKNLRGEALILTLEKLVSNE